MKESNTSIKTLLLCILLDAMGMLSFSILMLGESSDVVWAPIAAFIFKRMFRGPLGIYGSLFTFIEEIFPFSDVVPTFTIAWICERFFAKTKKTSTPFLKKA